MIVPLLAKSKAPATERANSSTSTTPPVLSKLFAVIAVLPVGFMVAVLVNVPFVEMSKLLKLKPVKEALLWVKPSVSIKFKLADETVPLFVISSAKFVTSIVTVFALIVALLLKSSPAVILRLFVLMAPSLLKSAPVCMFKIPTEAASKPLPPTVISVAAIEPNVFVPAS